MRMAYPPVLSLAGGEGNEIVNDPDRFLILIEDGPRRTTRRGRLTCPGALPPAIASASAWPRCARRSPFTSRPWLRFRPDPQPTGPGVYVHVAGA
jgi:hypothetical protein